MNTYEVCVTSVAEAMLERGFEELLAPEALDDGPATPLTPANAQTLKALRWRL
jgi:hypothetical protein